MNVQEALLFIQNKFKSVPFIINKQNEAKWLLSFILGIKTDGLIFYSENLNNKQINDLNTCIEKRCKNYPLDYILKSTYFWKDEFKVSEDTLIPRLDTETIIKAVLTNYPNQDANLSILDIGTGTGCIVLSLLREYKNAIAIATDISQKALEIAHINSQDLKLSNRVTFLNENIIESDFKFDLIVSNPPYIDINDTEIDPSVKQYEPKVALFADNNGLSVYQAIFNKLPYILKHRGKLFLEIGYTQKESILKLSEASNYIYQETYKDTANRNRVMIFTSN